MYPVKYILFKFFLISAGFIFLHIDGYSKSTHKADSLKTIYYSLTEPDSNKLKVCQDIALELSENQGNSDSIIAYIERAISIGDKIKNNRLNGRSYYLKGKFMLTQIDYSKATECFIEARKRYEAGNLRSEVGLTNMQFGLLMYVQENYKPAIPYFKKAIEDFNPETDLIHSLTCEYLMGLSYVALSENEIAESILTSVLKKFEKNKFDQRAMETRMGLSYLYINWNMPEKALTLADSCLNYFTVKNEKEGIIKSKVNIAKAYLLEKDAAKALPFLSDAKILADGLGKVKLQILVLAPMIESYKLIRNYEEAFALNDRMKRLEDSLRNIENKRAINALQNSMQLENQNAKIEYLNNKQELDKKLRYGLIIIACLFLVLSWIWYEKFKFRKAVNRQLDDLLHNILPKQVADELKKTGSAQARNYENVTVLFADFVNFTQLSEQLSPSELVAELDKVFSAFDKIIVKHNLEKIKTLGDSYMCAGGIPTANNTHPVDVINAALEMNDFISSLNDSKLSDKQWHYELRYGINSGPVVAGVVGIKKFAYDIWGDAVNIAARMEQNSEAGKINISENTYQQVKSIFNCTYRGKIKAKNKGEIDMYFVESKLHA